MAPIGVITGYTYHNMCPICLTSDYTDLDKITDVMFSAKIRDFVSQCRYMETIRTIFKIVICSKLTPNLTMSLLQIAKNSVLSIVALYRKPDEAMIARNR